MQPLATSLTTIVSAVFWLSSDAVIVETPPREQMQCSDRGQVLNSTSDEIRSILRDSVLPALGCLAFGSCAAYPAVSCKEIAERRPGALSGDYWIRLCNGTAVQFYCDMTERCRRGNSSVGWMRAAFVNMTDLSHSCPAGLRPYPSGERRVCTKKNGAGCISMIFPTYFLPYRRMCGRIIAYQEGTPDAFWKYKDDRSTTLDEIYIDGYSITIGYPRKHVWSFASGNSEGGEGADSQYSCPCGTNKPSLSVIPPFIENNYFCESGATSWAQENTLYVDDPLWDGKGCPTNSTCCELNNPPWFCKDLGGEFRSDIEVRYCGDEHTGNEEVPLELIEIYVQ